MDALTLFLNVAEELETAGLIWLPEIGDEVSPRTTPESISILVDPQGMTPDELRNAYLWLPSLEQLITQLESRQAVLFHAGFDMTETTIGYKTVIQYSHGQIESFGSSLRDSIGTGLRDLLLDCKSPLH